VGDSMRLVCPLCKSDEAKLFYEGDKRDKHRKYYNCRICDLIFVNEKDLLSEIEELNRYKDHNNNPEDKGYKEFIRKMYNVIEPFIDKTMIGLDYGCGPGPALAMIFRENGYDINLYDPFFYDNKEKLNYKYDFITCTEVVEHFYEPRREFLAINSLLKTNGTLGIMTSLSDNVDFKKWHYKYDMTHVVFYSKKTMDWISKTYNWELNYIDENVVIFKKK